MAGAMAHPGFALLAAGAGALTGGAIASVTARWPHVSHAAEGRCWRCGTASPSICAARTRQLAPRRLAIVGVAAAIGAASLWAWPGATGATGAVFGWILLALLVLDVEHFWLPDRLTLPLAVAGLIVGHWLPPDPIDRVWGCLAGFLSLTLVAWGYRSATGREGLGGGDPRLLAGIGAWLGWFALPFVLLLAAILGLALVGYDRLSGRMVTRHSRVPLGALLAAAAWGLWLAGPLVTQ